MEPLLDVGFYELCGRNRIGGAPVIRGFVHVDASRTVLVGESCTELQEQYLEELCRKVAVIVVVFAISLIRGLPVDERSTDGRSERAIGYGHFIRQPQYKICSQTVR